MRPDQKSRLEDLNERLIETVILDADPLNWTANDKILSEMTGEERGDANWCRKTAVQSVSLLIRVQQLLDDSGVRTIPSEVDTENEIKRAERAAKEMLDRVSNKKNAPA